MPKSQIIPIKTACRKPNPSLLEVAYCVFWEENIVKSQKEFSTCILGMRPSYYSCMRARKRTPTTKVLERLLKQTRLFVASCQRNPYFGRSYSVALNKAHGRLDILADTIEMELMQHWVRIPGHPPTHSDNIRPVIPVYPPTFGELR